MKNHILPSEYTAVVGVINPVNKSTAGSSSTGWISAADYGAYLAIIAAGAIAATASVAAKLEQATDSSGTGAKDITGKAITTLGGSDDNKQALINLRPEELDLANDFTHFRLTLTVADTASPDVGALIAALVLGTAARFEPVTQATTVAQTVA